MRVFLSGGTGMVGRNVADHRRAGGHELVAPDRATLDLRDGDAVSRFVRDGGFDIVVHAAGRVGGIADNMAHPVDYLVTNLDIGRNVVLAARDAGIPRLLNLSSSCVYPRDHCEPLTEDMILTGPLEPTNEGYALAKIAVMRLCEYVSRETPDLFYKTVIPCNIYGAYDKFDEGRAHLVPAAIAKTLAAKEAGAETVTIWGDGTSRREFMYAEDLADFIWEAIERFDDLPALMNVGLGCDLDINAYYRAAAEVIGWQGRFVHDLTKPGGMRRKLVDIARQRAFGWQPYFSLEEGVERTYRFHVASRGTRAAAAAN